MNEISIDALARSQQNKDIALLVRQIDGPGKYRPEDQPSESDTERETDWQPRRDRKTPKYPFQLTSDTWGTVDLLPPSVYDLGSGVRTSSFSRFVYDTRPSSILVSAPKPVPSTARDTTSVAQCEQKETKQLGGSAYSHHLRCGTQFDQGDLSMLHIDWMHSRLETECLIHHDGKFAQTFARDQKKRFFEYNLGNKGGSGNSSPRGTTPQRSPRGSFSHVTPPHGSGSSSRGSPYARTSTPLPRSPRNSVSHGSPLGTPPKHVSDPSNTSRSGQSTPKRSPRTILPKPPQEPAPEFPTILCPTPVRPAHTHLDTSLQVPMRPRAPSSPDNINFLNAPMFMWRQKMKLEEHYPAENVLATDTLHSAAGVIPPWDPTNPPSIEDVVKFSIWATDTIANHQDDAEPFTIHCQLPPANRTITIPGKSGGNAVNIEGGSRFSLIRPRDVTGEEPTGADSFLTKVEMIPDNPQDVQTYQEECVAQARAVQAYWEEVREVLDEHTETYHWGLPTLFPPPNVDNRPRSAGSSHGSAASAP